MNTKEYFKQLSIVILGILIAFWINNMGTHYKEHAVQKKVLSVILNEIKDNQKKTGIALKNLDSLRMDFATIQKSSVFADTSITIRYIGSNLKSIGYETAKYSGILKDINHKLLSEIVESYEYQKTLAEMEVSMRNEIFQFFKYKKEDNINYLMIQILNLITNMEQLETEQQQLIEDLSVSLKI